MTDANKRGAPMENVTMQELRAEMEANRGSARPFAYALAQDETLDTILMLGPVARGYLTGLRERAAAGEECGAEVRRAAEEISRLVVKPDCMSSALIYTAAVEWLLREHS